MKCASCGADNLIHDTRGMPYVYKGERTIIPEVSGGFLSCVRRGGFEP
jgi:HTH-type transcriptional regulator / antitoxin MqsA